MAMSLEDLLAKEGFRGRKSTHRKSTHRASFGSEPDNPKSRPSTSSSSVVKRTERAKSDIPKSRYSFKGELPKSCQRREKQEIQEENCEITKEIIQASNEYKEVYSNELYSPKTIKGSSSIKRRIDSAKSEIQVQVQETIAQPALDDVAVKAIASIFSGYLKKFLKDEDFRTSLRHNCFSSLNYVEVLNSETKVLENLEEAMEVVEKAAEDQASAKDLKRASLKLSLITGLNSNELKDGFTSRIPNSKLSACAHLYLSVIYKLQKKDIVSSKHILQVFIESPFAARTILVSDLWEDTIFPHLLHLKIWYDQETDLVNDSRNRDRKLKLLEKVYNEILDSGTYQFANYYKDWITEGVDAPSIPVIKIPSVSVFEVQNGDSIRSSSSSPRGPFSPQPMVSKKLYDAVFSRLRKPAADDGGENFEITSDDGSSSVQDKRTLSELHQPELKALQLSSHLEDEQTDGQNGNPQVWEGGSRSTIHTLYELPSPNSNKLTLEKLATSVFAIQHHDSTLVRYDEDESHPVPSPSTLKCLNEKDIIFESFDREQFSSRVPQDFICLLTRSVFEDPVTLETGQNFDRSSITEWIRKGNTTCPVTGKMLERQAVPLTNFVLKRVIDEWKSQHSRHLLNLASQLVDTSTTAFKEEAAIFIIENLLLSVFSKEEVLMNARCLVSIGGLGFLLRRFKCGDLEEKTNITAMLMCCIESESACRNEIAANIENSAILELIQSDEVISKENSVLLLTELICLNRKKDVNCFLSEFGYVGIFEIMQSLVLFLRSCTQELVPFVAVLLLQFDLTIEESSENEGIMKMYREEAVDALSMAMDHTSLSDDNVRENCCRALLILGTHFSSSGKLMTEDWILQKSGFLHHEEDADDENLPSDLDEEEREKWLKKLSVILLGNSKKKPFLEGISNCLVCSSSDMVRVSLITVAWLSSVISTLSEADEFHLSAFSALISPLKECLENGKRVEYRILASMSLFNFSQIPECRMLLMTITDEIAVPLGRLLEVTWTAKHLYSILSSQFQP